ncbi:hypothetical protein ACS0TY_031557 [Phlomoides rotata]
MTRKLWYTFLKMQEGPTPLEDMTRQIATAFGPYGNNRDYLFKLEKAFYYVMQHDVFLICSNAMQYIFCANLC